jgi:cation diffusion facilitator family transporter
VHPSITPLIKGSAMVDSPKQVQIERQAQQHHDARFAMQLSLIVGVLMLAGKMAAFLVTGSSAIFSDAAESVVHVVAVAFAVFSLWLSARPAVPRFHYGFERITFFSAGFEGAMIVLAAASIVFMTIEKWRRGLELERLGRGVMLIAAAGALNAVLGWYLLRIGKRNRSLILEADGKHVLTDSWTSFGVVAGLLLVMVTGWKPFDALVALVVAANILWSGGRLMWNSMKGLLDYSDPEVGHKIRERLDAICEELGIEYHGVRFRTTGYRQIIEVHLLFPEDMGVGEAHRLATRLEEQLAQDLEMPAEVMTHLESMEDHSEVHHAQHYTGKPD